MAIKGKSVRSVEKILSEAKGATNVRFVVLLDLVSKEVLDAVGFDSVEAGDTLIPAAIGKVTEFNAQGREVVRRDLAMEEQPVASYRSWQDWHGYSHSGIQHRYVKKYPREWIQAPSESLEIRDSQRGVLIATRPLVVGVDSEDGILHAANLMLECFGLFDIVDSETGLRPIGQVRRLNWEILPPGKYPWTKAKPLLGDITKHLSDAARPVVEDRLERLTKYTPEFIARGRGGFSGYVVFGYPRKKLYVLESSHLDNATYVFDDKWEALSQLTKAEIINGGLARERIIHDQKWMTRVYELLS